MRSETSRFQIGASFEKCLGGSGKQWNGKKWEEGEMEDAGIDSTRTKKESWTENMGIYREVEGERGKNNQLDEFYLKNGSILKGAYRSR